ncbi:TldD/PmbA family protein [Sphingomonas tabacisoli]|uniref:TldD/PmbA family protein n=1 Tax=Sphingomonas tabacisoli TaxID=2249466 RepID=A0ABW4I642_9SPHN
MLSLADAQSRLSDLVAAARTAGADAADALYHGDRSTDVHVRLGALENVDQSEGEEIGLRVFVGQRSASVSASDLAPESLRSLAERAVAMAREAPEDRFAGLAPEDRLLRGSAPDLQLDDGVEPDPATLKEQALAAEEAARAVAGVTNSEGASASAGRSQIALATSHGFSGGYGAGAHSISASMLAERDGQKQRDGAWHWVRRLDTLDSPETVGRLAGERAVARLGARKLQSGPMPVVFDPRVTGSLIGHFLGAISGAAIARKTSFLLEKLGQAVFAEGITIHDEPHRIAGLRSRPFDGEGLPTAPSKLIDAGVLTGWLLDSASARQLGAQPTGHAARGVGGPPGVSASNVYVAPGKVSRDALIGGVKRGLYVTELIGQGVNGVTGDYSRGAGGFLIEDGEFAHPVAEITIAGNLKDMFLNMTAADDLTFRYAVDTPTLLVEGMTIAGD